MPVPVGVVEEGCAADPSAAGVTGSGSLWATVPVLTICWPHGRTKRDSDTRDAVDGAQLSNGILLGKNVDTVGVKQALELLKNEVSLDGKFATNIKQCAAGVANADWPGFAASHPVIGDKFKAQKK